MSLKRAILHQVATLGCSHLDPSQTPFIYGFIQGATVSQSISHLVSADRC